MAGGLIQIATYGSQDLFLTGTPEITFFKVVFRRHTSFSMESISVTFDDPTEFNSTSVVKIPKVGDLMHRTYIEILLPEINLLRQTLPNNVQDLTTQLNTDKSNYQTIINFMYINRAAFSQAYNVYIAENSDQTAASDMVNDITTTFSQQGNDIIINETVNLLTLETDAPFTYGEISMEVISTAGIFNKTELYNKLSVGIDKSIKTQKFFYNKLLQSTQNLSDAQNPNIKFAWVDKIGHAILESIEIRIGGQKIDKHYGDWLNIWYELSANRNMEKIYFKMIGNVNELTTFNRNIKPSYLLKIPLQFWFSRFNGLSIPLVSLEYHNVSLYVKFRKFEELCYIESGTNIIYSQVNGGIELNEVPDVIGLNIQANLLIDYIYLDSSERRKFAQSSHEYLIEQLQLYDMNNVTQQQIQININNFVHPSKELIWVAQRTSFTINSDGTNQCRWDNYSLNTSNDGNPIDYSTLDFHSYTRVIQLDGNYFNYVQPYEVHRTSPTDGINMYSFSLFPEEYQPSGSANLSKLTKITLSLEFNDNLFIGGTIIDPLLIRIYTRNLNILRFIGGLSGIAFTYG